MPFEKSIVHVQRECFHGSYQVNKMCLRDECLAVEGLKAKFNVTDCLLVFGLFNRFCLKIKYNSTLLAFVCLLLVTLKFVWSFI